MAGIGFELRRLIQRDSLLSLVRAYAYAGIISSGPWVLSIVGMVAIGILGALNRTAGEAMVQFQVTVTWTIAISLILTGFFQLAFTRFVADRLFEHRADIVAPNYHAVLLTVTVIATVLSGLAAVTLFPMQTVAYRVLLVAAFVVACDIWIATVFLSGLKHYRSIVALYLLGYGTTVTVSVSLGEHGVEGLLAGFVIGQVLLFSSMHLIILRNFVTPQAMSFEFFERRYRYPSLIWIGFLFNFGAWIDKLIFWFWPPTSQVVIGPLRASVIYDLPVFLAYLSIIPGMAVFLVRIETDFVDHYDGFFDAVRNGGSLERIERHRNGMIETVRGGIFEILKIQAIATLLLFFAGERLLSALTMSDLYLPLLHVQTVAAGLQVLFLSILTVYFYLDKRKVVLMLTALFVVGNATLTSVSLWLGPVYYGYGFAASLLICVVVGFKALERSFSRLEYSTFMLQ